MNMDDRLRRALNSLTQAVDFLAKCEGNNEAVEVGAYKDALDWVESASKKAALAWKESAEYGVDHE